MRIIGVTGGIGTGKSTVLEILKEYGLHIINADKAARDVVDVDMPAYTNIINEFGSGIMDSDSRIDRKKLGDIVFNDVVKLNILNSIVHPEVIHKIEKYKELSLLAIHKSLINKFNFQKE